MAESAPGVFGATVRAVTRDVVALEHRGEAVLARRAASCLLAPRAADVVLCAETGGTFYVLAVLERADGEATTDIEVHGDLSIRSTAGSVQLDAAHDAELKSLGTVRVRGKAMALVAEQGSWVGQELRLLAEQLTLDATRIRQVSTFAERVAESLKESFDRAYRDVEQSEHVRAGSLTHSVRGLLRTHASTAVMTAKKLIKLDGDQIQLG